MNNFTAFDRWFIARYGVAPLTSAQVNALTESAIAGAKAKEILEQYDEYAAMRKAAYDLWQWLQTNPSKLKKEKATKTAIKKAGAQ